MLYSVLTYIFGGYEHVHEITNKQDDVEYILVTDNPKLTSNTWHIVYWNDNNMTDFDKVCYVRYHPFEFVSCDICVKIDGSIEIKNGDLSNIVNKFNDYDMCLMIHPERNTLFDEYQAWIWYKNYPQSLAENAYINLLNMGHNKDYKGLYQLNFSIQKNNEITKSINDITYSLIRTTDNGHCHRIDQIYFSFVLNNFFNYIKVMPVEEELVTNSKYFQWYLHGSEYPIKINDKMIIPYLFNKEINTITFN